jgi:outer membrane lipoprotein SlyB
MKRFAFAFLAFFALAVWAQTCLVCGEVRSIREINQGGSDARSRTTPGSPQGLDTGPVVGSVAQFHFGRGSGSDSWTFGAAGTPEMQTRLGETIYEVTVAMDMGERRVLQRRDGNRFHVGQRVALRSGELEPM